MHEAKMITTEAELAHLVADLLPQAAVAVDTEFFWERTFYPILGLVQLAAPDNTCWLVDAVSIRNLAAMGPLLASANVTKVLHDAPQDLAILARATGVHPRRIFDTRLAAGFAQLDPTCALQSLLRETLQIELCKAETRSDWLRRPLLASQLQYAAEDVRHLLALRDDLLARCANDTVRAWLQEDLARLDDASGCLDRDPHLMYLRVKGGTRFTARQLAILREVCAWRELEARTRDWPRGHVLTDDILLALVCLAPADAAALAGVPNLPRNLPDTVRADLLAAVARGKAMPDDTCPQPARAVTAARQTRKERADHLLAHIRTTCAEHRIHPALVASRGEAENYLDLLDFDPAAASRHPLAQGWRKPLVTR
ncbi:MAG: ribonuclease D [Kiritimatiellia bacterium]